jgi:hypothetical protein
VGDIATHIRWSASARNNPIPNIHPAGFTGVVS